VNAFEKKLVVASSDRLVHRFKIPASIGGDIREIGMVEITADEELKAEARCRGTPDKRAAELAKTSIVEVNGEAVGLGDGSVDKVWTTMHPKVRTLVATAWVRLHLASDDEVEGFFASRTSSA
jgi:hypothetical protein